MPRIVRGALLQATWTGDKESMIQKHEQAAHEASKQGAQVMLFQELFYGPYFCQVQDPQYYSYTELIPDGPTTKRMQDLAKQTGMVLVVPMYEEDEKASGIYYNTAAVIDADGKYLGKYRKTHIPHVKGFWEKFYFRPGNLGYPVFETAVGKVGVYICYDRHFPEGARALGLNGAEMVFIPSATSRGLQRVPVADRAGQPRGRERLLRRDDQPGRDREGPRRRRLLRPELLLSTRAASSSATWATPTTRSCSSATWTSTRSRRSARRGSSTATAGPTRTATSSDPDTPRDAMTGEPLRSPASHALADEKERIVRRMLEALERRDVVAIGELLADDAVYHFPGRSPVAGTYRGRDAVLGMFRTLVGLFDGPPEMSSHDVVASEAHVVDLATYTGVRGGQSFTWNAVRLYHVDADRIAEIWLMIGDVYGFDAFVE